MTAVAMLSTIVAAASPAGAAGELNVEVDGGGPLVNVTSFFPGLTRQSTISAVNNSRDNGVLRVRVDRLHEDDNGCVRAEKANGDQTCGAEGGELGRDLMVRVVPLDADDRPSASVAFSGLIRDLETWAIVDPLLPAGTERSFRFDWELPEDSPNDTQTDTVAFALEFVLEQATSAEPTDSPTAPATKPSVEGATLTRSPSDPPGETLSDGPASDTLIVGELPRTGLPMGPLAAWGGVLAVAGWVGRLAARRLGTGGPRSK